MVEQAKMPPLPQTVEEAKALLDQAEADMNAMDALLAKQPQDKVTNFVASIKASRQAHDLYKGMVAGPLDHNIKTGIAFMHII